MTAEESRKMVLSLPEASKVAHMGHPDFRVGGKFFATLSPPGQPSCKSSMPSMPGKLHFPSLARAVPSKAEFFASAASRNFPCSLAAFQSLRSIASVKPGNSRCA